MAAAEVGVDAPTEDRLPASTGIDRMTTIELLEVINAEDATVPGAVASTLPDLAAVVEGAVERLRGGGRIHYFGAGTSGRLAVIDAAELLPTFNAPAGLVTAHHAGGAKALTTAVEDAEDDTDGGADAAADLTHRDVAIGLSASGRTPFVGGALERARRVGALTALITANPRAELAALVDHLLAAGTGPEVITGSTRLKAGTAQKLILNAFSTAVMVRLGHTWSNLMVDLVATNAKLRGRTVRILIEATGTDEPTARTRLAEAGGELKPALLALLSGVTAERAAELLTIHHGSVAAAHTALTAGAAPPGVSRPTKEQ